MTTEANEARQQAFACAENPARHVETPGPCAVCGDKGTMYGLVRPEALRHLTRRAPAAGTQGVLPGILPSPPDVQAAATPAAPVLDAVLHGGRRVRFRPGEAPPRMSALCYRCTRTAVLYLRARGADVPPGYEWVGEGLPSTIDTD